MAPEVSTERPKKLDLRAPAKGSSAVVLGVIPQPGGEWLAAYATLRVGKAGVGPTLVDVCPISELPAPQQKRAVAWQGAFARLVEAAAPAH